MKLFGGEMFIRTLSSTLLQLFGKTVFHSKIICKRIIDPDDNCWKNSWSINGLRYPTNKEALPTVEWSMALNADGLQFVSSTKGPGFKHELDWGMCKGYQWLGIKGWVSPATKVQTFNSCTRCTGRSVIIHDRTPKCRRVSSAWMTSKLNVALVHRLRGPLTCLAFLTCYPWVFLRPGTGSRPVDWCRN